jgi:prepilin-type processing-associated H-X9-DG protein
MQCTNNQRNVASALLIYENSRNAFPGWRDFMNFGSIRGQASWVVQILPQLEEADLKSNLASLPVGATPAIGKIPVLFCPSANRKDTRGLNYQANAGAVDDFTTGDPWTYDTNSNNGVFLDSAIIKRDNKSSIVRLDDISKFDGTSATLLIAENVNAGFWIATEGTHLCCNRLGNSEPPTTPDTLDSGKDKIEGSVGFCWARDYVTSYSGDTEAPKKYVPFSSDCSLSGDRIPRMFNQCISAEFGADWYHSARPSSNHPGVVMVSFCDGHAKALRDDISEKVFVQLMTGRDKESDAKNLIGNDLLNKADYE